MPLGDPAENDVNRQVTVLRLSDAFAGLTRAIIESWILESSFTQMATRSGTNVLTSAAGRLTQELAEATTRFSLVGQWSPLDYSSFNDELVAMSIAAVLQLKSGALVTEPADALADIVLTPICSYVGDAVARALGHERIDKVLL